MGKLLRETFSRWWGGDSLREGAALAYFTVFSLAPVLVLAIAVAGFVFGEEAARGSVVAELRGLLGSEGAAFVETTIERASLRGEGGVGATILALGTILIGASGAFGELQHALDRIWEVPATRSSGIWRSLRTRLLSFGMVLLIGFLLLVSLVIAAVIAALDDLISRGAGALQPLLAVLQFAVSLALETLLFASMFKLLPAAATRWSDVWVGALVTALLFEVGKSAIGLYLGNSGVASTYGAAGSLVVVLIWVYFSSQILFLGAVFTRVWAIQMRGARPES